MENSYCGRSTVSRRKCCSHQHRRILPPHSSLRIASAQVGFLKKLKRAVMCSGKREHRDDSPNQRTKHIPLRVPDVALRTEEGLCPCSCCYRCSPLEKFIGRADGEHHADYEEWQPSALLEWRGAEQYLAHDDGRDKSLGKMSEAIIVVPMPSQGIAEPVEEGHLRIGVVPADDQNDRVDPDQPVCEISEREPPI